MRHKLREFEKLLKNPIFGLKNLLKPEDEDDYNDFMDHLSVVTSSK